MKKQNSKGSTSQKRGVNAVEDASSLQPPAAKRQRRSVSNHPNSGNNNEPIDNKNDTWNGEKESSFAQRAPTYNQPKIKFSYNAEESSKQQSTQSTQSTQSQEEQVSSISSNC